VDHEVGPVVVGLAECREGRCGQRGQAHRASRHQHGRGEGEGGGDHGCFPQGGERVEGPAEREALPQPVGRVAHQARQLGQGDGGPGRADRALVERPRQLGIVEGLAGQRRLACELEQQRQRLVPVEVAEEVRPCLVDPTGHPATVHLGDGQGDLLS
jgi:hypothetical protein